jgi:hypothetical protein
VGYLVGGLRFELSRPVQGKTRLGISVQYPPPFFWKQAPEGHVSACFGRCQRLGAKTGPASVRGPENGAADFVGANENGALTPYTCAENTSSLHTLETPKTVP